MADTAGVTAMAVHKHYANRQALLDDVAERAFRRLGESRGQRAEGADGESRVFGLLEDFLDFALGGPHLYTFLMTEPRERTRRFPDDFAGDASPAFTHLVVPCPGTYQAGAGPSSETAPPGSSRCTGRTAGARPS
ncbi:hypothetical protein GCM10010486_01720 [Nonomuraea roseoviolacea subsp. carminata]